MMEIEYANTSITKQIIVEIQWKYYKLIGDRTNETMFNELMNDSLRGDIFYVSLLHDIAYVSAACLLYGIERPYQRICARKQQ